MTITNNLTSIGVNSRLLSTDLELNVKLKIIEKQC